MTLQELLPRLEKVKRLGAGYTARCPGHEDLENSLKLDNGDDGRVLLFCHAGCAPEHICQTLGISLKDLFIIPKPRKRIAATYNYTDAAGVLLYQVVRYEPKGFAQRRPDSADASKWVWNLTATTRVLYNLSAVDAAIQAGKKVFLVEGEKDVETLRALGLTATTNAGGAAKWSTAYSAVLNRTTVVLIPDNDEPGRQHARVVAGQLTDAVVLELPGLPPKGDVTDWVAAGGTRQDLIALARQALDERGTAPTLPQETPKATQAGKVLFKPLGYNDGHFYFLAARSMQVAKFTAPALGMKPNLFALAPLAYWETQPDYMGDQGPRWQVISSDLIEQCYQAGIFRDEYRRGRGAWFDAGRTVLHLGEQLIVDGTPCGLLDHKSGYIYERAKPIEYPHKGALDTTQAGRLSELCQLLSWETPIAATLLAGWVALAPICGAMKWRPHIWLTGPSGSGKTWVMDNIIGMMLGDVAVRVQSSTTEAGLRQVLRGDALPVQFDEIETDDHRGQVNIQKVLELARQASSEGGSIIAKGTISGDAQLFNIRSMFCLSSIAVGVKRRADETRVSVLALRKPTSGTQGTEDFAKIQAMASSVCTREFAAGLVARSCALAKTIRRNADTFAIAVAQTLSSRRTGDQIGTLLAGAWSLWSDDEITLDAAIEYVRGLPLRDVLPIEETQDESRCLAHLLERRVRFDAPGGQGAPPSMGERSIAELITLSTNPTNPAEFVHSEAAEATLRRYGLRCDDAGLLVSTSHSGIAELLKDTPWGTGWSVFLRRLDGVAPLGKAIRFSGGVPTKAVQIPWEVVFEKNKEAVEVYDTEEEVLF